MVRQKYQGICTSFIIFVSHTTHIRFFIICTFVVLDIYELVLTNLVWLALKLVGNFQHLINRLANFKTSWLALKYIGYLALNVYNQNLTYTWSVYSTRWTQIMDLWCIIYIRPDPQARPTGRISISAQTI